MDWRDDDFFAKRLAALRMQRNVSAREMSLALGQNPSYINRIENRLGYPSMQGFFYICEYLGLTPAEFFDLDSERPVLRRQLTEAALDLKPRQLELLLALINELRQGC